ncbi:MAG: hypothetical protein Tsb009_35720 [Planctomycetaceae bacterium]
MATRTQINTPRPLVEQLEHFIQSRTNGMVRNLSVDIFDGQVVISGRTTTYYTKQLATHAVIDSLNDMELSNNIEVC